MSFHCASTSQKCSKCAGCGNRDWTVIPYHSVSPYSLLCCSVIVPAQTTLSLAHQHQQSCTYGKLSLAMKDRSCMHSQHYAPSTIVHSTAIASWTLAKSSATQVELRSTHSANCKDCEALHVVCSCSTTKLYTLWFCIYTYTYMYIYARICMYILKCTTFTSPYTFHIDNVQSVMQQLSFKVQICSVLCWQARTSIHFY
jgi:hypothetical protein